MVAFPVVAGGYGDAAQAAAAKAMEAQTKATNAQRKIQNILDRLPGDLERAKQIPEDVAMANRDISRAQTQGNRNINPPSAEATFIQSTRMQRFMKIT